MARYARGRTRTCTGVASQGILSAAAYVTGPHSNIPDACSIRSWGAWVGPPFSLEVRRVAWRLTQWRHTNPRMHACTLPQRCVAGVEHSRSCQLPACPTELGRQRVLGLVWSKCGKPLSPGRAARRAYDAFTAPRAFARDCVVGWTGQSSQDAGEPTRYRPVWRTVPDLPRSGRPWWSHASHEEGVLEGRGWPRAGCGRDTGVPVAHGKSIAAGDACAGSVGGGRPSGGEVGADRDAGHVAGDLEGLARGAVGG